MGAAPAEKWLDNIAPKNDRTKANSIPSIDGISRRLGIITGALDRLQFVHTDASYMLPTNNFSIV